MLIKYFWNFILSLILAIVWWYWAFHSLRITDLLPLFIIACLLQIVSIYIEYKNGFILTAIIGIISMVLIAVNIFIFSHILIILPTALMVAIFCIFFIWNSVYMLWRVYVIENSEKADK